MHKRSLLALLPALACVSLVRAQAPRNQVYVDGVYASRAMWRGTPRVSSSVTQWAGTMSVGLPVGHASATVWSLVELGTPDQGDYTISGLNRRLAEVDFSLQYAVQTSRLDLVAGFMRYQLNNDVPVGTLYREFGTSELYAFITFREGFFRRAGLTPSVRTWIDVNQVKGVYSEFDLTWAMPIIPLEKPLGVVHFSARTGLTLGQSTTDGEPGYFDDDGFTHIELLGTITGSITSWLGLGFTWHQSFGIDPATRRSTTDASSAERSSWGWLETWLTLRLPGGTR